jgi:hypothetical protein
VLQIGEEEAGRAKDLSAPLCNMLRARLASNRGSIPCIVTDFSLLRYVKSGPEAAFSKVSKGYRRLFPRG